MLINDVGGKFEEVNRGVGGGNYGWPLVDHGPTQDTRFVSPIHWYPEASISGGAFVPRGGLWPPEHQGDYLFADFVHGTIYALDTGNRRTIKPFATGLRRPVDLRFAVDGSLYVLQRNAWVIDDKFQPNTGSLLRVVPPRSSSAGKTVR
jgi:glucose/arabinose dehydrogenase